MQTHPTRRGDVRPGARSPAATAAAVAPCHHQPPARRSRQEAVVAEWSRRRLRLPAFCLGPGSIPGGCTFCFSCFGRPPRSPAATGEKRVGRCRGKPRLPVFWAALWQSWPGRRQRPAGRDLGGSGAIMAPSSPGPPRTPFGLPWGNHGPIVARAPQNVIRGALGPS